MEKLFWRDRMNFTPWPGLLWICLQIWGNNFHWTPLALDHLLNHCPASFFHTAWLRRVYGVTTTCLRRVDGVSRRVYGVSTACLDVSTACLRRVYGVSRRVYGVSTACLDVSTACLRRVYGVFTWRCKLYQRKWATECCNSSSGF